MESSVVCIISINNQRFFDSMSPESWLLHQPDSCHPYSKMGSDGSEHCIGFTFSTILQNSALIDLHHSASVWVCELFVFIGLPDTLYVSPENLLFFLWSKLFNDFKLQRMNVFEYCVGLPTQFALSIHWIVTNLSIMRIVCIYMCMQILCASLPICLYICVRL